MMTTSHPHPLSGVRVVEIGEGIAVAYCGKLLRDAGAEVVKLERPGGDRLRRYRPAGGGELAPGAVSPFFSFLAGGKRSVVVSDAGPAPAGLVASADILIVAASPAEAAALGLDPANLRSAAPNSTIVTVSNFGWTGPWVEYPATEFTLQAWCGSTGSRGVPERPPVAAGGDLGEFVTGGYAAFFALAYHYGGRGGDVDLSMLEAMCWSMQTFRWLDKDVTGLRSFERSVEVPSIEMAEDGYVGVSMATDAQWLDFCAMADCPQLAAIPELRYQLGRWRNRAMVRDAIRPWFRRRTVKQIIDLAARHRIPMVPVGNGATLTENDHFAQRKIFVEHPAGFRQPRVPWQMGETSAAAPAPAPAPGEANPRIDTLWPPRTSASAPGDARSPARGLPLDGLRILDLTAFWAGPGAAQLLAGLGAEVIKVESVQRPDGMRDAGGLRTDVERWWEYSWVFHGVNTNKKAVTLNLQSVRGRELFGRLVVDADVVMENFPARVMDRFGLSYDTLRGLNEQLILMRMPAFGLDGPWRDRGGFAMTMEQVSGLAWLTGYEDDVPMVPRGPSDPLAAVHAAFTLMCALEYRRSTGSGQLVEVPMIETVLNASALQVIEHDVSGKVLTRRANRGHRFAVQNVYACAGEEQWVALSIRDDDDWSALTGVLGQPDWATGAQCATEAARWACAPEIDGRLAEWFGDRPRDEAVRELLAAGVPAAPVVLPAEIADNPQLRDRRFLETVEHPLCGPIRYPRPPIAAPPDHDHFIDAPAPTLGQHNADVLCGTLQVTAEELRQLEVDGVIGTRPLGR